MFSRLKPLPKAILLGALVIGIGYGVNVAIDKGYINSPVHLKASVPDKIDLPTGSVSNDTATGTVINTAAVTTTETVRVKVLAWNATAGLHYANGGVETASGSLMDKQGLHVKLLREDDYSKMIADLAAFAKDPKTGVQAVIIMGDGYPGFVRGANDALKPFGQAVEIIGAVGYSRGEDKCVIDENADPRGSMIAGVLGDGDINICIKYAADNGIPVNSDQKTYDPNAMNFVGVSAFTDADEKFIAGAVEERGGKKIKVNGSATWTPGDVKLANKRGHFKVLASTKEYAWQMPAVVIVNKQWAAANPAVVKNFLAAAFQGGELVRSNDAALLKAGEVEAAVYGEQTGEYWAKYFKGTRENGVSLGGSTTNGLADNAFLFGLKGNDNLYKKVYTIYGNIAVKYFNDMVPTLLPYESVVNTKYLEELLASATSTVQAETPSYGGIKAAEVGRKSYAIEFDTGKATFTADAVRVLNDLLDQAAVTGLSVQINGHTDNVGNPETNLSLSKKRAEAVKQFLKENAPKNFPDERVQTRGYGDTQPIGDNSTAAGRKTNRRVEVILFSTK